MRREILLKDESIGKVEGVDYKEYFFIYLDKDNWVISHNPTKRAITYGLQSYRECKHFIDEIYDLVDDWSFKDAKEVDGCQAEAVRQYILTHNSFRSW